MTSLWIESLKRSSAYPHGVSQVTVCETHISWVLLTGEFAYKIKKPVRFDFLDFSTLQLREKYCREELRLNRRYAPDLYLDVVPITKMGESFQFGGAGAVVDYAVKMQQFDESGLLSHLQRTGNVTLQMIDSLARQVAEFHRSANILPPELPYARPASIYEAAEGNLAVFTDQTLADWPTEDRRVAGQAIDKIRAWMTGMFQKDESYFRERRFDGSVRECHGDLHLNNIVQIDGQLTMFDGIEFNPEFHWIDVLSDVAFLVMDLEDNGGEELGHRLLNTYLEQTGDYEGLRIWTWYLVYRAMVRAKVSLIRGHQQDAADEVRTSARKSTLNYLQLALQYIAPGKPELLITHGVSGSGKTYGTQRLVDRLGAVRVRSDIERKRLAGLAFHAGSHSQVGEGIYSQKTSAQVYEVLHDSARTMLTHGITTILDATYLNREERQRARQLADRMNVPFTMIPFDAPEDELMQRIEQRSRERSDASEATVDVLRHQLVTRDVLHPEELPLCRTVDEILSGRGSDSSQRGG